MPVLTRRFQSFLWMVVLVLIASAGSAMAATFTVTNAANTGAGSLRQAVIDSNAAAGSDTIVFDAGVFSTPQTIVLASVITINPATGDSLTITGPGANLLTLDGNNAVRVFQISAGDTVSISGMTLTRAVTGAIDNDGNLTVTNITFNANTSGNGGAIATGGASLTVVNCTFTDNTATSGSATGLGGGAIYQNAAGFTMISGSIFTGNDEVGGSGGGGAIRNRAGTMNISNSNFSGNTAVAGGGAIVNSNIMNIGTSSFTSNTTPANGGAISNTGGGMLTVNATVVAINSAATNGGGIYHQPNSGSGVTLHIANSTIANNTSNSDDNTTGSGGGLFLTGNGSVNIVFSTISGNRANSGNTSSGNGGGINVSMPMTLNNSTVSTNTAELDGGGVHATGVSTAIVDIDHATIVNNAATRNGGGLVRGSATNPFRIDNNIVANNTAGANGPDMFGTFDSFNYNLIENTSGATINGVISSNIIGVDPNVGPLQDNGGFGFTHALLPGSPAIDKGQAFPRTNDQRLQTRPVDNSSIPNAVPNQGASPEGGSDGSDIGSFEVQPVLQFSAPAYTIVENGGTAIITVTRTSGNQGVDSVEYATSGGSATGGTSCDSGVDFINASGTLTFNEGVTSQPFSVTLCNDAVVKGTETVNLTLSSPVGASIGTPSTAVLSITNDDIAPTPTPTPSSISGVVSYGTTPVGQAAKFVPGVLLTAAGSVPVNASTNPSGAYLLSGLGSGPYTITPSKSGDVNGISALDASRVAQHAAGLIVLTPNQILAGDATNNGTLSALDASRIAQFAAGITNPGIAGQWKFLPASKSYMSVPNSLSNENFEAILVGDVTGNWAPPAARTIVDKESTIWNMADPVNGDMLFPTRSGKAAVVDIELPANVNATTGTVVTIPISIADATGKDVLAYEFTLDFDPSVLSPILDPAGTAGTLSEGWSVTVNSQTPGRITVVAFSTQELSGAGILLSLDFTGVGTSGVTTPLKWTRFAINEDEISSIGARAARP